MSVQSVDLMNSLEEHLQRTLRPVQPNPAFVNRLQTHLTTPGPVLAEPHFHGEIGIAIGIGLAVGLTIMWLIRQLR
jgi:hypothetical protein